MTGFSARLRAKIDLVRPGLQAAARAFWTRPDLKDVFPHYLCAVHGVLRASVPLLEVAAQCARRRDDDAVARALADYYEHHAEEEAAHDEWLVEDLASLGVTRAGVESRIPPATVAALVGSQYYWVHHYHPVVLMGYIAVLEGPVDPDYYRKTIERTGLPEAAFRTLLLHATLDAGHEQELDDKLDSLPLTDDQESAIGLCALSTVLGVTAIFEEMGQRRDEGS